MKRVADRMRDLGATVGLAIVLAGGSMGLAPVLPCGVSPAFAHGAGGGNGGGHGGGNGDGHGGGNGGVAGQSASHGAGAASGGAPGSAAGVPGIGPANSGEISRALGALNAAHANAQALASAAPNSEVGRIAAYDRAMLAALALPDTTPAEIIARDHAIAAARHFQLALAAKKPLRAAVVRRVDTLLGLPPSDPALGLTP